MAKERKISGIKTWLEDDRPREKLLKKGAGALSNSELRLSGDTSLNSIVPALVKLCVPGKMCQRFL